MEKRSKRSPNGGYWSSKRAGLQGNHGRGNRPGDEVVVQPNVGKGILATSGSGMGRG